ncbi:MAG: hypothetical protein GX825_10525 [Syntrophomonadaceae bacterium]|nr:hypothetical protein [Syntrophomonadaceae bacterium]
MEFWAMRCGVDTKTAYKQMLSSLPVETISIDQQIERPCDEQKLHEVYYDLLKCCLWDHCIGMTCQKRGLPESKLGL